MANELMDQHRAELERHKAESADCQKMVNETLRKAAETHRKLVWSGEGGVWHRLDNGQHEWFRRKSGISCSRRRASWRTT